MNIKGDFQLFISVTLNINIAVAKTKLRPNLEKRFFEEIFLYKYPAEIYLFKIKNGNTKTMCRIFLKLTIRTRE